MMKALSIILLLCAAFKLSGFAQSFKQVKIGGDIWMAENLNVDRFRNGEPIPHAKTNAEWLEAEEKEEPAWCYYNNDSANGTKYGKLYNWYAVNDERGLAPEGWRLPSNEDWTTLTDFLGGEDVAGKKMKSTSGWKSKEGMPGNGSNSSGFSGLPGGYRYSSGAYAAIGKYGGWWSSTESNRYLLYSFGNVFHQFDERKGMSVRCISKNTAKELFVSGDEKYDKEDYSGAISDYTKAIEKNPKYDEAYYSRGFAKKNLKDYRGAVSDFDRAIKIDPKYYGAYYIRGITKEEMKDYAGAIADYSVAIKLEPEDPDAYYLRGKVRLLINQKGTGCLDLKKAGELGIEDAYELIEENCPASVRNSVPHFTWCDMKIIKTNSNMLLALESSGGLLWEICQYLYRRYNETCNDNKGAVEIIDADHRGVLIRVQSQTWDVYGKTVTYQNDFFCSCGTEFTIYNRKEL